MDTKEKVYRNLRHKRILSLLLVGSFLTPAFSSMAEADGVDQNLNASYAGGTASGNESLSMGSSSFATGTAAVAYGNYTNATSWATALGNNAIASGIQSTAAGDGATASGSWSTAIGYTSKAAGNNSVAIGSGSVDSENNTTMTSPVISFGSGMNGSTVYGPQYRQLINVADVNTNDSDYNHEAVNYETMTNYFKTSGGSSGGSQYISYDTANTNLNAGVGNNVNVNANLQGSNITTPSVYTTVIPTQGNNVIGQNNTLNKFLAKNMVVYEDGTTPPPTTYYNQSSYDNNVMGSGNNIYAYDSNIIGNGTSNLGSVYNPVASSNIIGNDITIGSSVSAANDVVVGNNITENGGSSVALGNSSITGNNSVAVGYSSKTGDNAISIGANSNASSNGTVIGANGVVNGNNSVAIGYKSSDIEGGVNYTEQYGEYSILQTVKTPFNTTMSNVVSFGSGANGSVAQYRQLINVGDVNTSDTDYNHEAVNYETMTGYVGNSLNAYSGAKYISYDETNSNLNVGYSNNIPNPTSMQGNNINGQNNTLGIASSNGNTTSNNNNINGSYNNVYASNTNVFGNGTSTTSQTIGTSTNEVTNSNIIGNNNNIAQSSPVDSDVIIGNGITSNSSNSVAIGNGSSVSGNNATALGSSSQATGNNSVALGNGSVASSDNTVSVGSGKSGDVYQNRRIQNVADGTQAHDAVNYEQLEGATSGLSSAVGNINTLQSNLTTLSNNTISYDNDSTGKHTGVSLNPNGSALQLHNVADGTSANDAVNYSQLQDSASNTLSSAESYGNKNFVAYTNDSSGNHTGVTINPNGGAIQIHNVANGTSTNDAVNLGQLNSIISSTPTSQYLTQNSGNGNFSFGLLSTAGLEDNATDTNDVALGNNTTATGSNAVGVGNNAAATDNGALAMGTNAKASGNGAIAQGYNSSASGTNSIAIGKESSSTGANSVALGAGSVASEDNTVSVGSGKSGDAYQYRRIQNVSDGTEAHDAVNYEQLQGVNSSLSNNISTLQGNLNTLSRTAVVYQNDSIGNHTGVNINPNGNALQIHNVANGTSANDAVNYEQLQGVNNTLTSDFSTLQGNVNTLQGNAVIYQNDNSGNHTGVSINPNGSALQVHNIAAGTADTDAVNVSQLKTSMVSSVGSGAKYVLEDASTDDLTVGNGAKTGNSTSTNDTGNTSLGDKSSSDNGSTATGYSSSAMGTSSSAYGTNSNASGNNSTALGSSSLASGVNATAVGNASTASGNNSLALGSGSQATGTNSVALGNGSVASNDNTVSVGSGKSGDSYQFRTVSNVADGVNAHDAANMEQLNNVSKSVSDVSSSVAVTNNRDANGNVTGATVNSGGNAVQVHNVAAGTSNTDVANVGQVNDSAASTLKSANQYTDTSVQNVQTADKAYTDASSASTLKSAYQYTDTRIDSISSSDSANSVQTAEKYTSQTASQYDKDSSGNVDYSNMTLKGTNGTQIHNVADGTSIHDAATVGQLERVQEYNNQQFMDIRNGMRRIQRNADAGTASAIAMANLPQAGVGENMMTFGMGDYEGQRGVALGYSTAFRLSRKNNLIIKIGGTMNTRGHGGMGAGGGITF